MSSSSDDGGARPLPHPLVKPSTLLVRLSKTHYAIGKLALEAKELSGATFTAGSVNQQRTLRSNALALAELNELEICEKYLARLQGLLDHAKGDVAIRRGALTNLLHSPIALLPEYVLRRIFFFVAQSTLELQDLTHRPSRDRMFQSTMLRDAPSIHHISQVCRSWRTTVLAQRALWVRLSDSMTPYLAHLWLARSNESMLTLDLDAYSPATTVRNSSGSIDRSRWRRKNYFHTVAALVEPSTVERVAHIHLSLGRANAEAQRQAQVANLAADRPNFHVLEVPVLVERVPSFSALESLHLRHPDGGIGTGSLSIDLSPGKFPVLRELSLNRITLEPLPVAPLCSVKVLNFEGVHDEWPTLLGLLYVLPDLVEVNFRNCDFRARVTSGWIFEPVVLDKLEKMTFENTLVPRDMVPHLEMPVLNSLRLSYVDLYNEALTHVSAEELLLQVPTVTHLSLWTPTYRLVDLQNMLNILCERPNPRSQSAASSRRRPTHSRPVLAPAPAPYTPAHDASENTLAQTRERLVRPRVLPNLATLSILPPTEPPRFQPEPAGDQNTPMKGADLYMVFERALVRVLMARTSEAGLPEEILPPERDLEEVERNRRLAFVETGDDAGLADEEEDVKDEAKRYALETIQLWRAGAPMAKWISGRVKRMEVWNYGTEGKEHILYDEGDDSWTTSPNPYPGMYPPTTKLDS